MVRPKITQIPAEWAVPFVKDYCRRWDIPYDRDEEMIYGKGVLWMGALYQGALKAVCGVFAADELPGELFVYGFYGDGTKHQFAPLRALIEFINKLPYNDKYGYILADNAKMVRILHKYGWEVRSTEINAYGRPIVIAGNKHGEEQKQRTGG